MKRTSFTVRAATLICALVLGTIDVAAAAPDHVRIGLGPAYPTYAIFAAAGELGYYAAQNLDVAVQTFRDGAATQDALAGGNVDLCAVVPIEAEHAIARGVRERIVAMFAPARAAGWYIAVPASSAITTVADLKGKTVGITQIGTPMDFWVQHAAKSANITVTTVALDAGVDAGLRAKRVDAGVLVPPASFKALISGDVRGIVDLGAAVPPSITEGIAASADLIDKRPDVLRRWISATSKAVRYMQDNEDWSEKFLKRYMGDDDSQIASMVYHNVIMKIDARGAMHRDWIKSALKLGPPEAAGVEKAPAAPTTQPSPPTVFSTAFTSKSGH